MKHISNKMICLICLLLLAMHKDFKSYKISNHLILSGFIIGLIFNLYEAGWMGVVIWFLGVMIPCILLFSLFLLKVLGAGDIKLFSVVGGFYGTSFVLKSILVAFIIAALMSVIHLVKYKQVFYRLHYLVNYIQTAYQRDNLSHQGINKKKIVPYYDVKRDGYDGVIHFSVAILAATLIQVLFHI